MYCRYAHQDKRDDEKLGLKSTALYFGDEYTKPILYGFSALTFTNWMVAGYNAAGLGQLVLDDTTTAIVAAPLLFGLGCGLAGSHLMWQVYTADLENANNLAHRFRSNNLVGGLVFGTIVAGNLAL
jgi:4-hydroxybenzoate polyprenyltransferase